MFQQTCSHTEFGLVVRTTDPLWFERTYVEPWVSVFCTEPLVTRGRKDLSPICEFLVLLCVVHSSLRLKMETYCYLHNWYIRRSKKQKTSRSRFYSEYHVTSSIPWRCKARGSLCGMSRSANSVFNKWLSRRCVLDVPLVWRHDSGE